VCGVCGTTLDDGHRRVQAMCTAMVHRGPDDEGTYVDTGRMALGARRLSVMDVAGGRQPVANENGRVVAVLNGEIYNHDALRRHLRSRGHALLTGCDTEVLPHLWEEYGAAMVHHLEGMFALAVWDADSGTLFLARDRFGEKPLFITERGGHIAFASELTALRRGCPEMSTELHPGAVDDMLTLGYVRSPQSMAVGARQLPPAHSLTWQRGRSLECAYWEPPAVGSAAVAPGIEESLSLLRAAVRARTHADVPLGVFLSGGIDSSLVAALAAEEVSGSLATFSVGYGDVPESETVAARSTAQIIGAHHTDVELTPEDIRRDGMRWLADLDQPIADPAFLPLRALSHHARKSVTVVLGGEGADEVFGGYPRYRILTQLDRASRWWPAPARRAAVSVGVRLRARGRSRAGRLAHALGLDPLEASRAWVDAGRTALQPQIRGARWRHVMTAPPSPPEPRAREPVGTFLARVDMGEWLPDGVLTKADRATMAASLEMRTPYLDTALVDLAARAPFSKHASLGGKAILRKVCDVVLPERSNVPKIAFGAPISDWLRGPLGADLEEVVVTSPACVDGWVDRDGVVEMIRAHVSGAADYSASLWPVLALATWTAAWSGGGV